MNSLRQRKLVLQTWAASLWPGHRVGLCPLRTYFCECPVMYSSITPHTCHMYTVRNPSIHYTLAHSSSSPLSYYPTMWPVVALTTPYVVKSLLAAANRSRGHRGLQNSAVSSSPARVLLSSSLLASSPWSADALHLLLWTLSNVLLLVPTEITPCCEHRGKKHPCFTEILDK